MPKEVAKRAVVGDGIIDTPEELDDAIAKKIDKEYNRFKKRLIRFLIRQSKKQYPIVITFSTSKRSKFMGYYMNNYHKSSNDRFCLFIRRFRKEFCISVTHSEENTTDFWGDKVVRYDPIEEKEFYTSSIVALQFGDENDRKESNTSGSPWLEALKK